MFLIKYAILFDLCQVFTIRFLFVHWTTSLLSLILIYMNKKKSLFLVLFLFCTIQTFFSEEESTIQYEGTGSYWMVERSDLRRYDNGRYTGLTQREVRSFVHQINAPAQQELKGNPVLITSKNTGTGSWFDGNFFVSEKTMSSMQQTALGLDDSIAATFFIGPDGTLIPIIDNGFPTFRSFPAFPREILEPGDTWVAEAFRSVDPLNKGSYTKLKMTVQYTFVGEEIYLDQEVFRIQAQWATRYGKTYWDFDGDKDLKEASGSHRANIIVSKKTGTAILIQDIVDETFVYTNGQSVQFKGSINLFTEFPPAVNTEDILPALGKIASIASPEGRSPSTIQDGSNQYDYYYIPNTTSTEESFTSNDLPNASEQQTLAQNNEISQPSLDSDGELPANLPEAMNDMVVEQTPAGLRLSVRNIQFLPDSSEFAPSEYKRLDMIAETLSSIPNAQFLVEGHSASTGNPIGEKQLSIERAQKIVSELVKRGLSEDKFLTNGFGSERPIASNETPEGMASNRRVEITILE